MAWHRISRPFLGMSGALGAARFNERLLVHD